MIQQLMDYDAFKDLGCSAKLAEGDMKIPVHFVYNVMHNGSHKARLVTGGHRTSTPVDSGYSGVYSLIGIHGHSHGRHE